MSFVDANLLTGEVVTFRTRLHWRLYVLPVLLLLLVMVPIAAVLFVNHLEPWSAVPCTIGLAVVLAAHVRRTSSEFAVTNRRVVIKLGVMTTRSLELLLPKIEGIEVHQGVGGRMWGYGDIVVTGSGGTRETFAGIQAPLAFRRAIQEATTAPGRPAGE